MQAKRSNSISSKRNAVHLKAGETVDPSVPGLKGPTLPPTADRTSAACLTDLRGVSCPGGVQPKRGWGLGQSPMSAEGALPLASLDEVQINRDRPTGWKKHCGRWTARGTSLTQAGKIRYCRIGCKCWDCSGCGPRRATRCRIQIAKKAEAHKLRTLLTLTLDPAKLAGANSTTYINGVFADFRVYLRRKLGHTPTYIRILEFQKNGNAHFHILLNCYLPQAWVSDVWNRLGGGRIVDVRRVDMHRISHYLSKYLTKEMLLHAPKRSRRVTCSNDVRLFEKQEKIHTWMVSRVPIVQLFDFHRSEVTRIEQDTDRHLVAFETGCAMGP